MTLRGALRNGGTGAALVALFALSGCGESKGSGSDASGTGTTTTTFLPSVGALVDKASPSTFQVTEADPIVTPIDRYVSLSTGAAAAEALKDFFTDGMNSISGLTGKGLIRTYLKDLDQRIKETNSSTEPDCLKAGASKDTVFNVGAGGQSLTLKLQCVSKFGGSGDQSGSGSGLAFGRDDNYVYLYLLLVQQNGTDKFGYVAKVNRSTEEVDLLFLDYYASVAGQGRTKFFRLKTNPTSKRYEVVYAGTGESVGPSQTSTTHVFSPGVRLVTDGTEIRAEGEVGTMTSSTGAVTSSSVFDSTECFKAADVSATATLTSASCTVTGPTFSTDMTLVAVTAMVGTSSTISSSLQTMDALIANGVAERSSGSK